MLPFILYCSAGVLTAGHVYVLLSLGLLGSSASVLELISLLGSMALMASGYLSLFRPGFGAKLALPASLGIWCFYGPAIVATFRPGRAVPFSGIRGAALPYLAVVFLVLSTLHSTAVNFRKRELEGTRTWLFPEAASRFVRIGIGVCSVVFVVVISVWFAFGVKTVRRPSSRFLIPDGYVGWVRVEFQTPGFPPVPAEQGHHIFRIPSEGMLRTSSPERYGWGKDEYFYVVNGGLRKLPTDVASGRLVWGQINGEQGGAAGPRQYEEFFVGTEQQFKELAGGKEVGPKPVADSAK